MVSAFCPPERQLMGPGPSNVPPRVLAAMAKPTIGHLDPAFIELMDEVKVLLQRAFRTENALTLPISGPGTAGMEAALVNLLEPSDTCIVCRNGVFGARMAAMAERAGARVIAVDDAYGEPVTLAKVEEAFGRNAGAKVLALVHAETSTGVCSDVKGLAEVGRRHGALVLVDAVTSLGGSPLEVDAWGLDVVYSGSQKCLSAAPGLSPITVSERAAQAIRSRRTKVSSWFLDLTLVMAYWGQGEKRAYHHTAPINAIYGLHEALRILDEEGLESAWARHVRHHRALAAGLDALGLELYVAALHRLPQLNAVRVPRGIDDAMVRRRLLDRHSLEIGGGLGDLAGKVWRIGLMGHGSSREAVVRCLDALEAELREMGLTELRPHGARQAALEVLEGSISAQANSPV